MLRVVFAPLQTTLFPERGTVFDFFFQKKGSTWNSWDELIAKVDIHPGAKVCICVLCIGKSSASPLALLPRVMCRLQ